MAAAEAALHGPRPDTGSAGRHQPFLTLEIEMETYVIRRRNAWKTPQELEVAAAKSRQIGDREMPDQVRWIRSYVVAEADGTLGTVCIYQATGPDAIRDHAKRVGMPADEIAPVRATVVVRDDPKAVPAAA
jgi:hypothetical protein